MALAKRGAIAAAAGPSSAETREPAIVQARGPASALEPLEILRVDDGDGCKGHPRDDRPPRRDAPANERGPEQDRADAGNQQTPIGNLKAGAVERGNPLPPFDQPTFVLCAGLHGRWAHEVDGAASGLFEERSCD